MDSRQYFVVRDGSTREGPMSFDTVKSLASDGKLAPNHLVWVEGTPDWLPASSVPGLLASFGVAPALASPPTAAGPLQQYAGPGSVEYAGFWLRFLAYLIDGVVLGGGILLVFAAKVGLVMALGAAPNGSAAPVLVFLVCGAYVLVPVALWLYFALMESSRHQGTVGKRAVGIKVTTLEGEPIGFGRASGRFFSKILSGMIMSIGYIMAAFTDRKQALHDMIAGTLVVIGK